MHSYNFGFPIVSYRGARSVSNALAITIANGIAPLLVYDDFDSMFFKNFQYSHNHDMELLGAQRPPPGTPDCNGTIQ